MSENKLTAGAFLRWVETQPPERHYDYMNPERCACARYAKTLGVDFTNKVIEGRGFWPGMDNAALGCGAERDWTYGQLAERLRRHDDAQVSERLDEALARLEA